MVFVRYYEPMPEMVKRVMYRAHDALSVAYDFTQTWVDRAPKRRRLMFGGHFEMDVPYYVMIPLHLLCV